MLSKCFSGSLLKGVIYVSRETLWDRTKFWKKTVTIFWKWVAKLKVFMETSSASCKKCILRVQKSILRQCLFLKREVCFTFLGQWPKTLGPPAERLPTTLIKLYITKPEKQAKQVFPSNLCPLNHFRRLSQRRSAVQQLFSDRSNKTAFYVSRETFWWMAIFEIKNQINLWRWVLNLKAFKRRCFGKHLKLLIAGPDDVFEIF